MSARLTARFLARRSAPVSARCRLHDTRGFILAEQIVSLVFLGLLCIAIAAGVSAAMAAYRTASESTRAQELLTQAVEELGDEFAFARAIKGTGANVAYVSPSTGALVRLENSPDGAGIALVPQDPALANDRTLFIPSNHGLTVWINQPGGSNEGGYQYNDELHAWIYRVQVLRADGTVAAETDMTVAWVVE